MPNNKEHFLYKKAFLFSVFFIIVTSVFAQNESDFKVGLTNDNTGDVIIKYIGKETAISIGKQLGTQIIVTGSILPLGNDYSLYAIIQIQNILACMHFHEVGIININI